MPQSFSEPITEPPKLNPFEVAAPWRLRKVPKQYATRSTHARAGRTNGQPWTPETLAVALQARGLKVIRKSNGYWAQCPCPEHNDRNPSLHFHAGQNVPLVVKCRSRCTQADVLKAIGPHPGWTSQPYSLQLPDDPAEWMCAAHNDGHLISAMAKWSPADRADFTRSLVHEPQRQRIKRVRLAPAVSEDQAAREEAVILLPARMGKVMRLLLDDIVAITNARLEAGDTRAVPYASRWAAERLDVDARQIRKALERLCAHGLIVRVDELPNDRWDDGTPLYALAVNAPCPICASRVEAGAVVAGLDAEDAAATGDRQAVVEPRAEQPQVAAVGVAEREDVVDDVFAAPVRDADGLVGPTVRGHAAEQYAAEATARECPFEVPFGPRPEPQLTKRRREWERRRLESESVQG